MRRLLALLLLAGCGVAPAVGQSKPTTTVAPTTTTTVPSLVHLTATASCAPGGWSAVWTATGPEGATVTNSIAELKGLQPLSWTGWVNNSGTAVYQFRVQQVWMIVAMSWPNPDGKWPRGGESSKVVVDQPGCG